MINDIDIPTKLHVNVNVRYTLQLTKLMEVGCVMPGLGGRHLYYVNVNEKKHYTNTTL